MELKEFMQNNIKNEKTIKSYLKDIELFENYLKENEIININMKNIDIKKYNLFLMEEGYSNSTISRKLSSLRIYFKYLRKEGLMTINPIEDIKQPIVSKRNVKINDLQWKKIMENSKSNKRDYLIFNMIKNEKVKISELIDIEIKDYNKEQGILYLKNKAISLSNESKEILNSYIKDDNEYLFESNLKNKLSNQGIYFIIKKYLKDLEMNNIKPMDLLK